MSGATVVVAGTGLWMPGPDAVPSDFPDLPVDRSRLRRMDRFGRAGFLAGSLALVEAGFAPSRSADASTGVVFGASHGCRDSLIGFTLAMREASSVDDLSPALFAQTVHNSVNGELGVAWGLGGVTEMVVSGRTGGSDAIARAGDLIAAGRQVSIVAGGAEGIHPAMTRWWESERAEFGRFPVPKRLGEAAGALLLETRGARGRGEPAAELVSSTAFFEPGPRAAGDRTAAWLEEVFGGATADTLLAATPNLDGALERMGVRWLADETGELYGASGAVGAVLAVREIGAGQAATAAVLSRDPAGSVTLLAFSTPRTA